MLEADGEKLNRPHDARGIAHARREASLHLAKQYASAGRSGCCGSKRVVAKRRGETQRSGSHCATVPVGGAWESTNVFNTLRSWRQEAASREGQPHHLPGALGCRNGPAPFCPELGRSGPQSRAVRLTECGRSALLFGQIAFSGSHRGAQATRHARFSSHLQIVGKE